MELIFAYGYGCCAFKHDIYGDRLEVPDDMPDFVDLLPLEFFVNPRCPPALIAVEVKVAEIDLGEAAKDPEEPRRVSLQRNKADFFSYVNFGHFGRFL